MPAGEPGRPGRKPTPRGERRDEYLRVRLSLLEWNDLVEAAERVGKSVSGFAREVVMHHAKLVNSVVTEAERG